MDFHKNQKVRLSVDCTAEERMYIKMLAARKQMTISEYLLSLASKEMPKCAHSHKPNETTKKALTKSKEEEGETFETLDDFWEAMGMKPNARD